MNVLARLSELNHFIFIGSLCYCAEIANARARGFSKRQVSDRIKYSKLIFQSLAAHFSSNAEMRRVSAASIGSSSAAAHSAWDVLSE